MKYNRETVKFAIKSHVQKRVMTQRQPWH